MNVKFNFIDSRGRTISRTLWNTETTLAAVLTETAILAPLWAALTDLELTDIVITNRDTSDAFAGAAISSRDENTSVKVTGGDTYVYDFNLPDMPDAFHPGESLDVTDAAVVAFFDEFDSAETWRINLRNPTDIVNLISGKLDK